MDDIIALYDGYLPENTKLYIEPHSIKHPNGETRTTYTFKCEYTSKKSGRKMCQVAKGDLLPKGYDEVFWFYQRQLYLTTAEQGKEFSRLYFLEKRAKQDMFLALGKLGNPRISGKTMIEGGEDGAIVEDRLTAAEYDPATQMDNYIDNNDTLTNAKEMI